MQYIKAIEGEMLKPTRGLLVRNWTEDVVNLVQYPRTHSVVNASPFCVKLETWLRITGIKHKVELNLNRSLAKHAEVLFCSATPP
ncbi:unnamed protein product [Meloidogyne enterolobii]|uniref:Uncharacterized protein n=1 Tax=Meloidogyne enterolobii TaxID=390850 RepID=A0ACB0ZVV0_MELEN